MFVLKAVLLAMAAVLLSLQVVRSAPNKDKPPTALAKEEVFQDKDAIFKEKMKPPKIELEEFKPPTEGRKRVSERDAEELEHIEPGVGLIIDGKPFYKSVFGCHFWGERPSAAQCSSMGDGGKDKGACATNSGNITCEHCEKDENTGTDHCPVMCGLCDGDSVHLSERTTETCTPGYKERPNHTMCMTDLPNIEKSGLKEGDDELIVSEHNKFRGIVEPPATDLTKMIWNEKLAAVAQKWANQCQLAHDSDRSLLEFDDVVGQNVAAGHKDWASAIKAWYDEIEDYKYGVDPETYVTDFMIGHFTQMVSNASTMVGCGYASCLKTKYTRYYVCNYLIGQSVKTKIYPYTKGKRCAACPNNCVEGVCDCKGKFCRNGGKLDPGSCECICKAPFKGDVCTVVICPPRDPPACAKQVEEGNCKFTYIRDRCPYNCSLCTENDRQVFLDVKKGSGIKINGFDYFKSNHGCSFYGQRPSKETCMKYGMYGVDRSQCGTRNGKYGCEDCLKFSNVYSDYCPVMCGHCDERDMSAVNAVKNGTGTTINGVPFFKSLQGCSFWGKRPSAEDCAAMGDKGNDMGFCVNVNCDACEKYTDMGTKYCPGMCGLCDPSN